MALEWEYICLTTDSALLTCQGFPLPFNIEFVMECTHSGNITQRKYSREVPLI